MTLPTTRVYTEHHGYDMPDFRLSVAMVTGLSAIEILPLRGWSRTRIVVVPLSRPGPGCPLGYVVVDQDGAPTDD